MEPRILIIGKNSFIGKNIQEYSRYKNIDSVSLREVQPDHIPFKKYDIIIYLAAIVHQTKEIPESEYYRVNCDLPVDVAKKAKGADIKQFIYLSTIKVYGSKYDYQIKTETSPCYPDDPYGKSKYQAELQLKELEANSFKVSIVRTPIVYGEGVKANMLRLIKLVERHKILPFAGIHNKRSMTYTGNLVAYLDCIIDKGISGTFVAKDNLSLSTTELVESIALNLNKNVRLVKLPKFIIKMGKVLFPKIMIRLFCSLEFDNSLTKNSLDCQELIHPDDGIRSMIKDYLKHNSV